MRKRIASGANASATRLVAITMLLVATARTAVAQDSVVVVSRPSAAASPLSLRELLAVASAQNVLPATLLGYRATVETEISVLLHRDDRTEIVGAVEQLASTLQWERNGRTDQHVIGYRTLGTTVSMLGSTNATGGWLTPTLYGNRFRLRVQRADSARPRSERGARADANDTLPAVHPLATDRERFYQFTGGDTIVTLRTRGRTIPIVHVAVRPRTDITEKVLLFDGEMDLDASRGTLVRIRGRFVRVNAGIPKALTAIVQPVAFIEYENGERNERYWLPAQQRIEVQVSSPVLGEGSAVIRIVSRFNDMVVQDTAAAVTTVAGARLLRRLTYAPNDSLDRYSTWRAQMGAVTATMNADDFANVGPDRMRKTGKPRFDIGATRLSDVVHFNRVEGLYTGGGVRFAFRDAAPGVVVRATAGYAWKEETVRGRVAVERTRGLWTTELRAGRSLDNTNEFRTPFDSGSTIFSFFGSRDPYDYVDRRSGSIGVIRRDTRQSWLLRADVGPGDDRFRPSSYERSIVGNKPYPENRGVDEGSYLRTALLADWRPNVSYNVLLEGVSARVMYERGDGTLSWQRTEARATARRWFGPVLASARVDGGVTTGARIPSQQLFELGERQGLPGYEEKEFAGSRAAVVRAQAMYQSQYLRRPIRLAGPYRLPAIAPGFSIGVQSGWAETPSSAARGSLLRLGLRTDSVGALVPVSRVTDGARATVSIGLRAFSGRSFAGFARPIDQSLPWKFVFTSGAQW